MDVLLRSDGARVGFPFVAAEEIAFQHRETHAYECDEAAPPLAVSARDGGGSREAEGEAVEEVGESD